MVLCLALPNKTVHSLKGYLFMSKSEIAYCGHCKMEVGYHYDPVNHRKQLFMTVLSLGLWLPIWLCLTFGPSKICDECGEPIWNDQPTKAANPSQ